MKKIIEKRITVTLETTKANLSFGRFELSVRLELQSVISKLIYIDGFSFRKIKIDRYFIIEVGNKNGRHVKRVRLQIEIGSN